MRGGRLPDEGPRAFLRLRNGLAAVVVAILVTTTLEFP